MADFRKRIQRFTHHLTRTKARAGWSLAALAATGYFAADAYKPLQELCLIIVGVAASAVFLPELSEDLWTMRPERIRMTVPDHQIAKLQRTLLDAQIRSAAWAEIVWLEGLSPLLAADRNPDQVIWDSKYDVSIRLANQGREFASHRVETLSRARRILPRISSRTYCVSATRTTDALMTEFAAPHCLARELIVMPDIDGTRWRDKVLATCRVRVSINGLNLPAQVDSADDLTDVVRWNIEVPTDAWIGNSVAYTLQFDFPIPSHERSFPVIFNGYYGAGTTEISMRLSGCLPEHELECAQFIAHGLDRHVGDLVRGRDYEETGESIQFAMFSTPGSSLLPPGSGLLFTW